jgi:hypothetical protein
MQIVQKQPINLVQIECLSGAFKYNSPTNNSFDQVALGKLALAAGRLTIPL